jgi:hypothetical protein
VIDVLRHLPPESRHVEAATLPSATLCLAEQCGKIGRDKLLSFTL